MTDQIDLESRKTRCVQDNPNLPEKAEACQQRVMEWFRASADEIYTAFYRKQNK